MRGACRGAKQRKKRRKQTSGHISNAADPRHAVKERETWTEFAAYVMQSRLCRCVSASRLQAGQMFRCLCHNHWPLPSEAIKLHLTVAGEVVNLHDSESVITFTGRDESLSAWKVIATLLPQRRQLQQKRVDDQLIIAILVLICF